MAQVQTIEDILAEQRIKKQQKEEELRAAQGRAQNLGGISGALFGGLAGLGAGLAGNPALADEAINARNQPAQSKIKALQEETKGIDDNLMKIAEKRAEEQAKFEHDKAIKQMEIDAKNRGSGGVAGLSEGEKAVDKDFAKTYNDWLSSGRSQLQKNLDRLQAAKEALGQDPSLTGGIRGNLPDVIRNITNEKAIRTRDDVRAAAQGALKATLGAQFTEKEGERIMNQAYNEKLSPQANIAKIEAALRELESNKQANDARGEYFQKFGTLRGFSGVPVVQNSAPSKIQVSNGRETLEIDPADLAAAQADGYRPIKSMSARGGPR